MWKCRSTIVYFRCAYRDPIIMKKRPNKRPRYGAIFDSSCKENSVSATSKPAKNAPSAMERPACFHTTQQLGKLIN